MQLRFLFTSRVMMLSSLLAAGAFQAGFAQTFNPSAWNNSDYGIAGGSVTSDFCNHPAGAGGPAPTVNEAVASAVCSGAHTELSQGRLVLIDDLKIKIGIGRPFDNVADAPKLDAGALAAITAAFENPSPAKVVIEVKTIDHSALVYPLSGSFTLYECESIPMHPESAGKNCNSVEQPEATGTCYKGTSGSWQCQMNLRVQPSPNRKEWDNQWTHQGVPPPERPEPAEEGVFYLVNIAADALPFTTSLQPMEKQAATGSMVGTRVTLTIEGQRAAMRLNANSSPQFRIKPKAGGGPGMLVRFGAENGTRTVSVVDQDGKVTSVEGTIQSKFQLIGPSVRISVLAPLVPGEYGLYWGTFKDVYVFGVD
jgi:hypothetical protein